VGRETKVKALQAPRGGLQESAGRFESMRDVAWCREQCGRDAPHSICKQGEEYEVRQINSNRDPRRDHRSVSGGKRRRAAADSRHAALSELVFRCAGGTAAAEL
jgi:hypothetical protein